MVGVGERSSGTQRQCGSHNDRALQVNAAFAHPSLVRGPEHVERARFLRSISGAEDPNSELRKECDPNLIGRPMSQLPRSKKAPGAFSAANPIIDQSVHVGIGFEAWTYPWLLPLFWMYQATDSSDNTLDWKVESAGYVAAVAYNTQLSGRVNL